MVDLPDAGPLATFARLDLAIRHQIHMRPDASAIVDGGTIFSYSDLETLIDGTAAWLDDLEGSENRIGILIDNSIEAVVAILACIQIGRTVVPINTKNDPATVCHIVEDAGIGVLIVSPKTATDDAEEIFGTKVATLSAGDWPSGTYLAETDQPSDEALIYYTSGSTGKPKGVVVSHRTLVLGADSVAQYLNVRAKQRIGAVLPISFDAGLNWVMTGLCQGAEVHLMRYIFPKSLANDLAKHKIEALLAVPSVFFALSTVSAPDDHAVKTMASTGGRMDASIVRTLLDAYDGMQFVVMYGLTEAFRATYLPPAQWEDNQGAIGRAIPHAAVHIIREDGTEAADGEIGEIVQSGPLVSLGYLNRPDAMKDRFGPCPAASPYASKHPIAVYSGDFGTRDKNGIFTYVGRKDRLIKSRGFRIAPEEIEKAVVRYCGIKKNVVLGKDDLSAGQRIILVVETAEAVLARLSGAAGLGVPRVLQCRRGTAQTRRGGAAAETKTTSGE